MNLIANFLIFASIQWSLLQEQNKETVCKFRFWVSGGKTRIPNHFWFFSEAAQDVIILIETVLSTVFCPRQEVVFSPVSDTKTIKWISTNFVSFDWSRPRIDPINSWGRSGQRDGSRRFSPSTLWDRVFSDNFFGSWQKILGGCRWLVFQSEDSLMQMSLNLV